MKSARATCPSCGEAQPVPEDLRGKNVRCKHCGQTFPAAAGRGPAKEEPLDVLPYDEHSPGRQGLRQQPSPAPRRRPDADPPPRARSSPAAVAAPFPVVWVVAGVVALGLVLAVAAGSVAAWWMWPAKPDSPPGPVAVNNPPAKDPPKPFEKPPGDPALDPHGGPVAVGPPGGVEHGPPGGMLPPGVPLPPGGVHPPGVPPPPGGMLPPGVPPGHAGPRPPGGMLPGVPEAPPRAHKLELPPLPDPVEIKPAPVTKETAYKLPEPVSSLRVGGGGRFLILHFPKMRKYGIFDANEAKIVRYVAAPEGDALYAGGMTKLVVYLPGAKVVQSYNLLTGAREHVGKLDLPEGKLEAFCLGHASAGPLLVGVAGNGARLYDIDKFKEIPLPPHEEDLGRGGGLGPRLPDGGPGGAPPRRLEGGNYWAGATGRVFGHTGNWGMPNGVKTVVLEGGKVQQYGEHQGTWFVMPGPDDKHVYAGGHGVVSTRVKPVANVPFSMGANSGFASHLYLPAHHGPFYLHAMTIEDFGGGDKTPIGTVRVYLHGDKEPIATYEKTGVCKYGWEGLRGLGIEHSLHLIPKAKLLAIVPESRDELRLYPADLDAALDKTGRDYLLFTSTPPSAFHKGKAFTYRAEAKSRKGRVTFKLEGAPKGMTVDGTGLVRWAVPADFAEGRVDVILAAKGAGGQEVFQTFTLAAPAGK